MTVEPTVEWFEIRKETAVAYGRPVPTGFLVVAGSTAMLEGAPKKKRERAKRDRLILEGVLVHDESDGALLRFSQDYIFTSKSAAAGVVIDGNSNGAVWKPTSSGPSGNGSVAFGRDEVEAAMDAYDGHLSSGEHADIFGGFRDPQEFWVRSTRSRSNRVYPTKPIHFWVNGQKPSSGGWGGATYSAAALHNAGYIIVDANDVPVPVPPERSYLIRDADRIRRCALNYYIEPAREQDHHTVSIRAGTLHDEIGLSQSWANVCQALAGRKFQELAGVAAPTQEGPDQSTSTVFTYSLEPETHDTPMDIEVRGLKSPTTNLILYGPPGTGKTYAAPAEAVRLCNGFAPEDRAALMQEYARLTASGRIEFVTFHQSYSYEEFVEGLRPVQTEGLSAGFSLQSEMGTLRRVALRAEKSSRTGAGSDRLPFTVGERTIYKMSIGEAGDPDQNELFDGAIDGGYALIGWASIDWSDERYRDVNQIIERYREAERGLDMNEPTAESGRVQQIDYFRNRVKKGDIIVVSKGNGLFRAIGVVTGDYTYFPRENSNYAHRRAVNWLWVDTDGVPREEIYAKGMTQWSIYKLNRKHLNIPALERYINSGSADQGGEPEPFVLIIDEINRANISKVFGELITLLEPDKRIGQPNELKVRLPYSRDLFGLPANLHIVGTMNTADRSIALLDTALRRRFEFRELMPDPSALRSAGRMSEIDLERVLRSINERIEYLFDREHQVGHAYFMGCRSREDVDSVMRDRIIPLLTEYFYSDWSKVAAVLGDATGAGNFLERRALAPPTGTNGEDGAEPRYRWSVKLKFADGCYEQFR